MDQYRMIDGKDFTAFLSGFSAFTKKVALYVLTSIRSYPGIFIIVLLAILSAGAVSWYTTKPFYEAEMACDFHSLTKKTYGEMLHKLDILVQNGSYNSLAVLLHLPVAEVQPVTSIEGRNSVGSLLYEDITNGTESIYIDVKARDNKVFTALQPALITYLNTTSPALLYKIQQDSINIQDKIKYYARATVVTDSIISAFLLQISKAGIDSAANNLVALRNQRTILDDRRTEAETAASLLNTPRVIHGFTLSDHMVDNRPKTLKIFFVTAIVLACAASILSRIAYDIKAINKNVTAAV